MKDAAGLISETGETDTSGIEPKTQESGERTRNESTQTVPFCGFATDRQLTFETDHIGGSARGYQELSASLTPWQSRLRP